MAMSLIPILENLGRPRVLVVGDLILDRYVWGDAERVSQEAPVILLRADHREERLGGAASVASMLAALETDVTLAGVVGADVPAPLCRELLKARGINDQWVFTDSSRPTTLKERYIGRAQQKHPQQMMRVDYEVRHALAAPLVRQMLDNIQPKLHEFDVVLISDYDKGVCVPELTRPLIDTCRKLGLPILVDPIRGGNYQERYHGCTGMTPNRLEASLASGITIIDPNTALDAATKLQCQLSMDVGIVTLDKEGMVLVDQTGARKHFPVRQREVYDITGAGDMVLAVLGMVLAAGHDYPEAILLANAAGGLEVERIGVATLTRAEIIQDLLHVEMDMHTKTLDQRTLLNQLDRRRRLGQRVVFTNGCFDILHAGHVHYLREARAQGDLLVVGLNTDQSVRRQGKGTNRPINDQDSRADVLAALQWVDYVCLFDEDTPLQLIQAISPDVLVKGADYRPEEVVGKDYVESYGGRLHLASLLPGRSTTATLKKARGEAA